MKIISIIFAFCVAGFASGAVPGAKDASGPPGADPELDCAIRELAWQYAQKIQPWQGSFGSVFDALQLGTACNQTPPAEDTERTLQRIQRMQSYGRTIKAADFVFYVDAVNGDDERDGSFQWPFRTIQRALVATRGSGASSPAIVLRQGVYEIGSTIALGPDDSGLTIIAFELENAVISGGTTLNVTWTSQGNVAVADVSAYNLVGSTFNSLFVNGRRAIRARYPNANPEITGRYTNPSGYIDSASSWSAPFQFGPSYEIHVDQPTRNPTVFPDFSVGIGGWVSPFNPPQSYWGTASPHAGSTWKVPSGLTWDPSQFTNKTWKNASTGIVHAFHGGYWGGWQFQIESANFGTQQLAFSRGGFQEARGWGQGGNWYVDNVLEELDSEAEWFFDESTNQLYYWANETLDSAWFVATVTDTLFSVVGSQESPVRSVSFVNVEFAFTATTFMQDYLVPSGGDWSIHRGGGLYVEGAEDLLVTGCLFNGIGGNGLYLSSYIRGALIEKNEFVWIGDTGIALIGESDLISGLDGNQPRNNTIQYNLVHEIGVFGKQTAPYVQSVSCQNTIAFNIFFNGPRAGININDGFGGGNLIEGNLIFNMVRETSDHGPINSWDRQPYVTDVLNGTAQLMPAWNHITRNFLINNYASTWPLDHDDGSCYYLDDYNYMIWGGFKNYLGHSKQAVNNVYVYPDLSPNTIGVPGQGPNVCAGSFNTDSNSGWDEVWSGNTCIVTSGNVYNFNCDASNPNGGLMPLTANNTFYTPNAQYTIGCSGQSWNLTQAQKAGIDVGSTVQNTVDTATVVSWGKELLGL